MSEHVVIRQDFIAYCLRCGETTQVVFPVALDDFCIIADSFVKRHSICVVGARGEACRACFRFHAPNEKCGASL